MRALVREMIKYTCVLLGMYCASWCVCSCLCLVVFVCCLRVLYTHGCVCCLSFIVWCCECQVFVGCLCVPVCVTRTCVLCVSCTVRCCELCNCRLLVCVVCVRWCVVACYTNLVVCCVCDVLSDAVCFVCCLCVCLIGACVRVCLFCHSYVFVWIVCDMVCDAVSLCSFVLCVFSSRVFVCVVLLVYTCVCRL